MYRAPYLKTRTSTDSASSRRWRPACRARRTSSSMESAAARHRARRAAPRKGTKRSGAAARWRGRQGPQQRQRDAGQHGGAARQGPGRDADGRACPQRGQRDHRRQRDEVEQERQREARTGRAERHAQTGGDEVHVDQRSEPRRQQMGEHVADDGHQEQRQAARLVARGTEDERVPPGAAQARGEGERQEHEQAAEVGVADDFGHLAQRHAAEQVAEDGARHRQAEDNVEPAPDGCAPSRFGVCIRIHGVHRAARRGECLAIGPETCSACPHSGRAV
jgi:hypothetical protein